MTNSKDFSAFRDKIMIQLMIIDLSYPLSLIKHHLLIYMKLINPKLGILI